MAASATSQVVRWRHHGHDTSRPPRPSAPRCRIPADGAGDGSITAGARAAPRPRTFGPPRRDASTPLAVDWFDRIESMRRALETSTDGIAWFDSQTAAQSTQSSVTCAGWPRCRRCSAGCCTPSSTASIPSRVGARQLLRRVRRLPGRRLRAARRRDVRHVRRGSGVRRLRRAQPHRARAHLPPWCGSIRRDVARRPRRAPPDRLRLHRRTPRRARDDRVLRDAASASRSHRRHRVR